MPAKVRPFTSIPSDSVSLSLIVPIQSFAEPIIACAASCLSPGKFAQLLVHPRCRFLRMTGFRPKGGKRQHYRPDGTRRRTAGELAARAARAEARANAAAREAEAQAAAAAGEEEATAPFGVAGTGEDDAEVDEEEAAAPLQEPALLQPARLLVTGVTGKKRRRSSLTRQRARQWQLRDPLETHHGGNPGPGLRVGERGTRPPLV